MDHYPVYAISSGAQTTSELLFGGLALLALLYCVRIARRERKIWPLSVFGGSMLLFTYEPINNFLGAYSIAWQSMFAASVVATIPVIVLFAVIERKVVSGLTAGSIK